MTGMTIGRAAAAAGLPVKTVRYYADIALVGPHGRSAAGYRVYNGEDVARLTFVRCARAFGFSVEECRDLLALHDDSGRASADVKRLALSHLEEMDARLTDMIRLRDDLARLVAACAGDDRPDCPILGAMATGGATAKARSR